MINKTLNQVTIQEIKTKIFIYPTDTIYGLGCNALNRKLVEKIREIKNREEKPLSIIAPNKQWILENFISTEQELNKYLPGPYTLLLKKKDLQFLPWLSNNERIGVRIPKHEISEIINAAGIPFVTTSVNISSMPFAKRIVEISSSILENVDIVIDSGELNSQPSTLIIDGLEIKG